jgi:secreted trypsin-like serine protease
MYCSFRASVLLATLTTFSLLVWQSGAQEVIKPSGGRIVGGIPTDIRDHPWQVALLTRRPDGTFLCGGSIIAEAWILTAAHCFGTAGSSATVRAKAGATNIMTEGVWTDGDRIIPHLQYQPNTQENDIALVRVRARLNGSAIALAAASVMIPTGEVLEITGWGATTEGGAAVDSLRKAEVRYVATETCNEPSSYDGQIKAGMMCAGFQEGGTDTCQGDSGGPLVMAPQSTDTALVGVTSFGEGCAQPHKYGIYTRVSQYRSWIASTIVASN